MANPLTPTDEDIKKMLACRVHVGTKNLSFQMTPYVWKRRQDGVYLHNIGKTWEKIMLAARIIAAVENPADVCVVASRTFAQRGTLKMSKFTGCSNIVGRITPGSFTNQIQKIFLEPRVLLVTDPLADHQAVQESSFVNLPVIALCDTDAPLDYVDVAIPCNIRGRLSVGLVLWLLTREVLRLRGAIDREDPWEMPDLFFYVDAEEMEAREAERLAEAAEAAAAAAAPAAAPAAETYDAPVVAGDAAATELPPAAATAAATGQNWPGAGGDWPAAAQPQGGDWGQW